jgi:transposase-like protein
MEQRFKSLSIFDFQNQYSTKEQCLKYLDTIKWKDGFICKKCKNNKFCDGNREFDRQCSKCSYVESVTAGTLFHKVKFDIVKAFYIVYFISTNKKGITTTELSRKLELRQKTCWLFKRKVMKAMESSNKYPLAGIVEVDETVIGGQEEGVVGRKNNKKKLVVIAIEKKKKGVSRFYAKVIDKANAKNLGQFMKDKIEPNAEIKTDKWNGYTPLKKEFVNMKQVKSGKKGEGFPEMHRVIMNFKGWLRGVHHSVSDLQEYINEYTYRFNRSFMTDNIFDNLITRMVYAKPCPYQMIIS